MKVPVNKIQKITVNKSDEVALVVEKIIDSEANELVLSIPRFSKLADSLANFHLIKRESELLKKKIVIESVDDKVVEFAGLSGLDSLNPIFSRSRRQFSDIVSAQKKRENQSETKIAKRKLMAPEKELEEEKETMEAEPEAEGPTVKLPKGFRKLIWTVPAAVLIFLIVFLATSVLPKADISIVTAKTIWEYNDSIRADKLANTDPVSATVPAQVFSQKESAQLSFPASGKKQVANKAGGKITIFNAYSSDPQPLVATTRFIAPDGKVFRLVKSVTVPGAKIIEGKIIPSTLEAEVIADKAGADYNIGPVSYFNIPGFKGTPKFQAFYAESKEPMAGGFIGETAYPTAEDIKNGKVEIVKKLESSLSDKIKSQIPSDFIVIDGASSFSVPKQDAITNVDSSGKFSIEAEASMTVIGFTEADIVAMLAEKVKKEKGDEYEIKKYTLTYEKARADFSAGKISFPAKFSGTLARKINTTALKESLRGQSEESLRSIIYGLPELESATISLWPFWVKTVPSKDAKITINID